MNSSWTRPALRIAVLAVLVATALAVALVPAQLTAPAPRFSAYAEGDLHASAWKSVVDEEGYTTQSILASPTMLHDITDPTRTAFIVLGPERSYTDREAHAVDDFLARGGSLLVADTSGTANPLVADLPVRFGAGRLLDTRHGGDSTRVVIDAEIGIDSFTLRLNHPSILLLGEGFDGRVLAQSGPESFLDVDGDGEVGLADLPGPFPVLAAWTLPGGGRALLMADVGVFLDAAMAAEDYDHHAFHRALVNELLPDGGELLIDESVHGHGDHANAFAALGRAAGRIAYGPWTDWALALVVVASAVGVAAAPAAAHWTRHEASYPIRRIPTRNDRLQRVARDGALRLLTHRTGLLADHLKALPASELRALTPEPLLAKALLTPDTLTPSDLSRLDGLIDEETRKS